MMRKPYHLASVLLIIILCSWMMDATILDVESSIDTQDLRTSAGPQDAFAYNVSGYSIYRNAVWNRSFLSKEEPLPAKLMENQKVPNGGEGKAFHKSNITTLLLIGYGVLGIVGFWRRVKP